MVDWARGSEADTEECVDRGEIPFGRSGPACRWGVDSSDGGRRVEVVPIVSLVVTPRTATTSGARLSF